MAISEGELNGIIADADKVANTELSTINSMTTNRTLSANNPPLTGGGASIALDVWASRLDNMSAAQVTTFNQSQIIVTTSGGDPGS